MRRGRLPRLAVTIGMLVLAGCRREESARAPDTTEESPRSGGAADTTSIRTGPVTIQGAVLDEVTGDGVAGAIVIVLKPGVSSQEWGQARGPDATQALMAAVAVADARGLYEVPDLERGRSYTVMVTAEGYAPVIFENGLDVTATDPAIIRMQPVEL
jgi:hypothetical protein